MQTERLIFKTVDTKTKKKKDGQEEKKLKKNPLDVCGGRKEEKNKKIELDKLERKREGEKKNQGERLREEESH